MCIGMAQNFVASLFLPLSQARLPIPGAVPVVASALVLLAAAVIASVLPAARAAGVDVMQALRSD
jgi:putative ABC transport system permease protein